MIQKNHIVDIQKYFLPGTLLLLIIMMLYFMSAFLGTLLMAGVVVTGVYPVHKILNRKLHLPKSISALISLVLVAIVIIGPLTGLLFFVAEEATDAYSAVSTKINLVASKDIQLIPALMQKGFIKEWSDKINAVAPISSSDVFSSARDIVGKISSIILGQTTNILKNFSIFLIQFVVFLLTLYYFLRDGERLVNRLRDMLPMAEKYREELFNKLSRLSYGIIYGIFGAALVQGFLVGLGLYIVGVKNAAFWGTLAAIFSPLPYIGTAIVWVPVVIWLAITGSWGFALFLLIWGAVLVGTADNIVKPYLIGSSTALHPLAVLLVLLGGAFVFGIKGLMFGPFVLTLTLSFLHIYELEYKSVLHNNVQRRRIRGAK
jgi:predicted PurR-regulated permease PerM